MSVWLDHVKETRKKCPGMPFKDVLKEAKKTYDKKTKTAGPVVCKSTKSTKSKSKRPKRSTKKKRKRKRKTMGKGRGRKGKAKTLKKTSRKIPKKFKCKMFPNAPNC